MGSYHPTQDGFLSSNTPPWAGTGLWDDTSTVFGVLGTLGPSGLIFDLDPAYVYTAASLTLTKVPTIIGPFGTLKLYVVNAAAPDLFSQSNLPTITGATLAAEISAEEYDTGPRTWSLDIDVVNSVTALPGWVGRLAFVLIFVWAAEGVLRTFASQENADPALRPVLVTVGAPIPTAPDSGPAWSQASVNALKHAIASGVRTVAYADRTVQYRTTHEMLLLLGVMEASVQTASATALERFSEASFSRD